MLKAVQQPSTRMLIVYCQHHHQALHTTCCARLHVDSGHSVEGGGANARCVTLLTKVMREAVSGAGVVAGTLAAGIAAAPVDVLGYTLLTERMTCQG